MISLEEITVNSGRGNSNCTGNMSKIIIHFAFDSRQTLFQTLFWILILSVYVPDF